MLPLVVSTIDIVLFPPKTPIVSSPAPPEMKLYPPVANKSSTIKKLKSGGISKKDQQHFLEFKRQQYLYSKAVMEEFGEGSVKALWWNMFKDRDWIKIPFNKTEYQEAQNWALDTIHLIENETEWLPNTSNNNWFYCVNLCGINCCEYRP